MRGLPADGRDTDALAHADRPREIFAEDFRMLFGSELARESGLAENALLAPAAMIFGLRDFLLDLPERARRNAIAGRSVAAYPNPFRTSTTVQFSPRAGAALSAAELARPVRVLDVRGRVVRRASVPAMGDGSFAWRWDGCDDRGVRLAPGSYFVSDSGGPGRVARILLAH
jgi:hypothetical protein